MAENIHRKTGASVLLQEMPIVPDQNLINRAKSWESAGKVGAQVFDASIKEVGKSAQKSAVAAAMEAAVHRDEKGKLTWHPPDADGSIPTDMAIRAGTQAYMAAMRSDMATKAKTLSMTHRNDPAAFNKAWKTHLSATVKESAGARGILSSVLNPFSGDADLFKAGVAAEGARIGTETYNGLIVRNKADDMAVTKSRVNEMIQGLDNEYSSLIANGGAKSSRALELATQRDEMIKMAIKNGVISRLEGEVYRRNWRKRALVMQGMSRVEAARKRGGLAAAKAEARKVRKSYREMSTGVTKSKMDASAKALGANATFSQRVAAWNKLSKTNLSWGEADKMYAMASREIAINAQAYGRAKGAATKAMMGEALKIYNTKGFGPAMKYWGQKMKQVTESKNPAFSDYRSIAKGMAALKAVQGMKEKIAYANVSDEYTKIGREAGFSAQKAMEIALRRYRANENDPAAKALYNYSVQRARENHATEKAHRLKNATAQNVKEQRLVHQMEEKSDAYWKGVAGGKTALGTAPPWNWEDSLGAVSQGAYSLKAHNKMAAIYGGHRRAAETALEKRNVAMGIFKSVATGRGTVPLSKKNLALFGQQLNQNAGRVLDPGKQSDHAVMLDAVSKSKAVPPQWNTHLWRATNSDNPKTIKNALSFWRQVKAQGHHTAVGWDKGAMKAYNFLDKQLGADPSVQEVKTAMGRFQKSQAGAASGGPGGEAGQKKDEAVRLENAFKSSELGFRNLDDAVDGGISRAIEDRLNFFDRFFPGGGMSKTAAFNSAKDVMSPELRTRYREMLSTNIQAFEGRVEDAIKHTNNTIFGVDGEGGEYTLRKSAWHGGNYRFIRKHVETEYTDKSLTSFFERPGRFLAGAFGLLKKSERHYVYDMGAEMAARHVGQALGLNADGTLDRSMTADKFQAASKWLQGIYGANMGGVDEMKMNAKKLTTTKYWRDKFNNGDATLEYVKDGDTDQPAYRLKFRDKTGRTLILKDATGKEVLMKFAYDKSPAARDHANAAKNLYSNLTKNGGIFDLLSVVTMGFDYDTEAGNQQEERYARDSLKYDRATNPDGTVFERTQEWTSRLLGDMPDRKQGEMLARSFILEAEAFRRSEGNKDAKGAFIPRMEVNDKGDITLRYPDGTKMNMKGRVPTEFIPQVQEYVASLKGMPFRNDKSLYTAGKTGEWLNRWKDSADYQRIIGTVPTLAALRKSMKQTYLDKHGNSRNGLPDFLKQKHPWQYTGTGKPNKQINQDGSFKPSEVSIKEAEKRKQADGTVKHGDGSYTTTVTIPPLQERSGSLKQSAPIKGTVPTEAERKGLGDLKKLAEPYMSDVEKNLKTGYVKSFKDWIAAKPGAEHQHDALAKEVVDKTTFGLTGPAKGSPLFVSPASTNQARTLAHELRHAVFRKYGDGLPSGTVEETTVKLLDVLFAPNDQTKERAIKQFVSDVGDYRPSQKAKLGKYVAEYLKTYAYLQSRATEPWKNVRMEGVADILLRTFKILKDG